MEKIPEIRIVGNASEEHKEKTRQETYDAFFNHLENLDDQKRERLKKDELVKTEQEIELIKFANEQTNILAEQNGFAPFDLPSDNYHVLPGDVYGQYAQNNGLGQTEHWYKAVYINDKSRIDPLVFGSVTLHETMHMKGNYAIEDKETSENEHHEAQRRSGIQIASSIKKDDENMHHVHFAGVNEAIVSTVQKKLHSQLLNLPMFAEQKKWLESPEAAELKQKYAERENVSPDEIMWLSEKDENYQLFYYSYHRRVLDYVCQEIQKEFPDKYENTDDVFNEFLNVHFSGKLLPLARLIEKTFGKGGFRTLGNMEGHVYSANLIMEAMQKARQNKLKQ